MPRGAREKQREQAKKERKRQPAAAGAPAAVEEPRAPPEAAPDPEVARVAAEIADRLGETGEEPRATIWRAVVRLGAATALALAEEALAIEAQGGMWLSDGSRRRTTGGVFFNLVRQRMEKPDRLAILYPEYDAIVALAPEELAPLLAGASAWQRSAARQVRIVLTGRPDVIPPPDVPAETPYVIFNMASGAERAPALAKSLPPIAGATTFRVLASTIQWRKIAPQLLERPDMAIGVLGDAAIVPKRPGVVTVRASSIKLVQLK